MQKILNLKFVNYWGKLYGTKKDYDIIVTLDFEKNNYFPETVYYWR